MLCSLALGTAGMPKGEILTQQFLIFTQTQDTSAHVPVGTRFYQHILRMFMFMAEPLDTAD